MKTTYKPSHQPKKRPSKKAQRLATLYLLISAITLLAFCFLPPAHLETTILQMLALANLCVSFLVAEANGVMD